MTRSKRTKGIAGGDGSRSLTLIGGLCVAALVAVGCFFLSSSATTPIPRRTALRDRSKELSTAQDDDDVPTSWGWLRKVPRVHNISYLEFRKKYHNKSPVVIEGSMLDWPKADWSWEGLDAMCGDNTLYTWDIKLQKWKHAVTVVDKTNTEAWAGAASGRDILAKYGFPPPDEDSDQPEPTMRDLLAVMRKQEADSALDEPRLYLHDATIQKYCPEMFNYTRIPRYFPIDYTRQVRRRLSQGLTQPHTLP